MKQVKDFDKETGKPERPEKEVHAQWLAESDGIKQAFEYYKKLDDQECVEQKREFDERMARYEALGLRKRGKRENGDGKKGMM